MLKSVSSSHGSSAARRRLKVLVAVVPTTRRRKWLPWLSFMAVVLFGVMTLPVLDGLISPLGGTAAAAAEASTMTSAETRTPVERIPDGRMLRPAPRRKPRRSSLRSQELERQREEQRLRTIAEIDAIHAEYWQQAGSHKSWPTGTAYARFSTRFQDSIADQIRSILEYALAHNIRIPRHLIFFDLAVRGVTNRRVGLDQVRSTLGSRKATVLLLFSTNRLFRKTYLTLQFVDSIYRELRARCIFVTSGIDTDNADQWESLLHLYALMDQFVVRMAVSHIHAAHKGMLERRVVFGTLSYGYDGRPIEGELTKLGKPRRELMLNEGTAEIVRRIFRWYVEDRLDIIEIVRRLNADPTIPLPPRAISGRWTRLAVRTVLKNTRYRGMWRYGVCESVFLPDSDYVRQRTRVEPLKEVRIESLRIVDDRLWYGAQERLAGQRSNGGRPITDGDHESRPKLLNGLVVCPTHEDQALYVAGPNGNAMVCPLCQAMSAAERPLYTVLNRRRATEMLIAKVVELLSADDELIARSIAVCKSVAEGSQRPDPATAAHVRQELRQLERAIAVTRRTVGESEEDQAAAERTIRDLQGDAAGLRAELARLETADSRLPRVPTTDEIRELLREAATRLTTAVGSHDREVVTRARRILELLTDGRIALEQQGPRSAQRGWLRGRFRVRLLTYLVEQCGGVVGDDGAEITIDFRRPSDLDAKAEQAWQLYQHGALHKEISLQLPCGKLQVTKYLKHAAKRHGVPYEDGRRRRFKLPAKQSEPPRYVRLAPEVGQLVEEGLLLFEIGERLKVNRTTLTKAYNKYRVDRGLPPLDGRARRKLLGLKDRPRREDTT